MIMPHWIDAKCYWIPEAWLEFTINGARYRRNERGKIELDLLPPPGV